MHLPVLAHDVEEETKASQKSHRGMGEKAHATDGAVPSGAYKAESPGGGDSSTRVGGRTGPDLACGLA